MLYAPCNYQLGKVGGTVCGAFTRITYKLWLLQPTKLYCHYFLDLTDIYKYNKLLTNCILSHSMENLTWYVLNICQSKICFYTDCIIKFIHVIGQIIDVNTLHSILYRDRLLNYAKHVDICLTNWSLTILPQLLRNLWMFIVNSSMVRTRQGIVRNLIMDI